MDDEKCNRSIDIEKRKQSWEDNLWHRTATESQT